METPTTFEAHGHTWTKHNAGDGYPCDGDKKVLVCLKDGTDSGTSSMAAEWWEWDNPAEGEEIIGWRFAAPPQEKDEPPADWRKDSSLETWFPLTAQELTRLRGENASMREERATYHKWLNKLGAPSHEKTGLPMCLLRRLAVQLGIQPWQA